MNFFEYVQKPGSIPPDFPTLEEKLRYYRRLGHWVPSRKMIKTTEQIEGIRQSGEINTAVLDAVASYIRAGISTEAVDQLVYDFTVSKGAVPAPLHYENFPKSVCISINEEVCHGIPDSSIILKEGDIVNVDVSTVFNGYYSDASRMFMIGEISEERRRLVQVTRECLELGIQAARPWGFLGDIGEAIQKHAESQGYSVVRDFCGHGVGLQFHEQPEVEHTGKKKTGMLLVPGMVFTIEPMINMGRSEIFIDSDNEWTVITADGLPSAQWENTLVITESGTEILTY